MSQTVKKRSPTWRRIKFTLLRFVIAPCLLFLIKFTMRTWRVRVQGEHCWDEWKRGDRRCVVALFHGTFFCALGTNYTLNPKRKSRLVTMVSPSQDGRLLADIMASFDTETVSGSSRARGAAGLLEMIDAVSKRGHVGVLAVDGPRGPRGVPREGIITLANALDARMYLYIARASHAIRFNSWDRAEFPLPFARVDVVLDCVFDAREAPLPPDAQAILQERMLETLQHLGGDISGIERLPRESDQPC